jgi:hypothetical protein
MQPEKPSQLPFFLKLAHIPDSSAESVAAARRVRAKMLNFALVRKR